MMLSCANLFYRDVKYVVDVILTFAIFFTPVFYDASLFGKWETLLLLNPIGAMLECINDIVINHQAPKWIWFYYSGINSILSFFIGWNLFHKVEPVFAERI